VCYLELDCLQVPGLVFLASASSVAGGRGRNLLVDFMVREKGFTIIEDLRLVPAVES
jgi:hypothetical protein